MHRAVSWQEVDNKMQNPKALKRMLDAVTEDQIMEAYRRGEEVIHLFSISV